MKDVGFVFLRATTRNGIQKAKVLAGKMLLENAFKEMEIHKIYSYVFAKFIDEAEFLKSTGFTMEAVLIEEAVDTDGNYQDIIRFAIFNG